MPEYSEEIDLDGLGITIQWIDNAITGGMLLTTAVDFMKKIDVLSEFMGTIKPSEQRYIIGLVKCRPKELGENPFE